MFRSVFCVLSNAVRARCTQTILIALLFGGAPTLTHAHVIGQIKLGSWLGIPWADGAHATQTWQVEPTLTWSDDAATMRIQPRLRYRNLADEARTELDWRELTAQWRQADITVSLGAQQIQWGRMDLLRVTDTINPLDQHDLFVHDLSEAKLALWMLNLEWQYKDQSVQLIISPQVPLDRLRTRHHGPTLTSHQPAASLAHATWGLRYGWHAGGWTGDLTAVQGWRSSPLLRIVPDLQGLPTLQATPVPQTTLGISADRAWGPWVLRGEALTAWLRPPSPWVDSRPNPRPQTTLGIGLDRSHGPWWGAVQLVDQPYLWGTVAAGRTQWLSLIVQRKWHQDRLSLRAVSLHEVPAHAHWHSMQARYELNAHTVLQLQADRFAGPPQSSLGAWRHESRLTSALVLQF